VSDNDSVTSQAKQ